MALCVSLISGERPVPSDKTTPAVPVNREKSAPAAPAAVPAAGKKAEKAEKTAAAAVAPKRPPEVRAIWVTRWDFRTEEDVRKIVAGAAVLGLNRIFFQVRGQADAFYPSSLEPWGEDLGGPPTRDGNPGFDPLKTAIDEAHARGIALHAWLNVLPAWKGPTPPRSKSHLVHTHPEWFLTNEAGKRKILDRAHYSLLNPCLAAVRAHLAAVFTDLAGRYAVDGVQLDYIRFMDRDIAKGEDVPFDPATLKQFRKEAGGSPADRPAAWDAFRRRAIDQLVADISTAVRAKRTSCTISVAAIRDFNLARTRLLQDAAGWRKNGWIEEVYPMIYEPTALRFGEFAGDWARLCGGDSVVPGIGVHLLDGGESLRDQIRSIRRMPVAERPAGYCLFAYSEFFPSTSPECRRDAESLARRSAFRLLLRALNRPQEASQTQAASNP